MIKTTSTSTNASRSERFKSSPAAVVARSPWSLPSVLLRSDPCCNREGGIENNMWDNIAGTGKERDRKGKENAQRSRVEFSLLKEHYQSIDILGEMVIIVWIGITNIILPAFYTMYRSLLLLWSNNVGSLRGFARMPCMNNRGSASTGYVRGTVCCHSY